MSVVSYGTITLVDLTDLGTYSVYPMSNLPISVVNDPNANSYVPNWQNNNLTITPVAYYAGSQVTPTTVTWTVQINSGSEVAIDSAKGEAKNASNALVVSKNRFAETDVKIVTYYCTSTYVEPESGSTLTAKGQISYSLVQQASAAKTCDITGENVFKYNTNSSLVGSEYITLTGNISGGISISKWQYKNSSGTWTDYPVTSGKNTNNTSSTLNVYASEDVFVNDIVTIKLLTSDSSVFDIFTIAKLRDGAAGEGTVTSILSNENQMIPCNAQGNPTSYDGASTTIYIYDGGQDSTSTWTIADPTTTANAQVGCTGTWNATTHTYTVTGMTADAATVTLTCTKTGYANIIKTFNLIKMKVGANGTSPTIYTIEPSALALNRNKSSVYSPTSVTFNAYSQTGSSARASYSGVFKIYINGSATATYTSVTNESSKTYTPSGNTVKTIKCELYVAGGGGNPVDTQTVVVTDDGATGEPAYTVLLGNENQTFSGNLTNAYATTSTCTVDAYKGTTKISTKVGTITGCPDGLTITTNNNESTSTTLAIDVTTSLTTTSGTVTIPITADGKSFNKTFTYSLALKGDPGQKGDNAILFEIVPEGNDKIVNDGNNVVLAPRIMDGGTTGTLAASSCSWAKYNASSAATDKYDAVNASQVSANKLTVTPAMVDGYAMFRCVATYASKTYTAYYAVADKTDPVQVYVFSTVGEKLLNGNGNGAVYAIAERNGVKIDEIPEIVTNKSNATGTSCYVINTTNNRLDYYSRTSTSVAWSSSTSSRTTNATYTWTFRDKDGNATTYNSSSSVSGQAIYIDGDFINKKLIIDVRVDV